MILNKIIFRKGILKNAIQNNVFWLCVRAKSDVKSLIKDIDRFSESEAMELHMEFESLRKRMDKIVHKGNHFFVFAPIMHEIRKTSVQIKKAEEALFVKAYPDYENPLTKEQSEELYGLMSSWREDEKTNMETY